MNCDSPAAGPTISCGCTLQQALHHLDQTVGECWQCGIVKDLDLYLEILHAFVYALGNYLGVLLNEKEAYCKPQLIMALMIEHLTVFLGGFHFVLMKWISDSKNDCCGAQWIDSFGRTFWNLMM